MNRSLLSGLSTLLFPFAAHAAATAAGGYLMRGGYQPRSHARLQVDALSPVPAAHKKSKPMTRHAKAADAADAASLDILPSRAVTELVVIDGSVADKATLYRGLKPGVMAVEIDPARPGLPQLADALRGYHDLAAIHVVSHADAGVLQLGNSRITAENVHQELSALSALRHAVRPGGDLLFYGCDLAAGDAGGALLDIIQQQTGLDVAASSNLTGNAAQGGDWDLEIRRGNIETSLAFSDKALADFSDVLVASNGTRTFNGWSGHGTPQLSTTDFKLTAKDGGGTTRNVGIYNDGSAYMFTGAGDANNYLYLKADGINTTAFELTGLTAGEYASIHKFKNVRIVGILHEGGTVSTSAVNNSGTPNYAFTFGASELANFTGQKLSGFKLYFDCDGPCATPSEVAAFEFRDFTIQNAINTPPRPTVTDARISISGASGTGGAYKIGDTVTASWNNTAGGDNNSGLTGVTMDFSQFGGGSAVTASNSGNIWTASYTIAPGAIDATNRNVSVTATNAGGSRTTADSTNATVDNIAPTVSDANIGISGATGTGGAYKIGDTVTATWNNTAGGDNNSDTISSVAVNFTQFGGGAAVAASNSGGTWRAGYTIVPGTIDDINRNVTVTATDNVGNATATSDTSNATVDNIAPSVSGIVVDGAPDSGATSMAFAVNFSELVTNVSTDDFTLVGTGSATGMIGSVSAGTGSSIKVNISAISGVGTLKLNLNGATNVADAAGNAVPAYTSGSTHSVDTRTAPGAPTAASATAGDAQATVTFTAPASNGGSAISTYTATANSGTATGTCSGPAACSITVTNLTNGTPYTFTVTATNVKGTSAPSGASSAVTPKRNQTITFLDPGAQNFGTSPTLTATSDSGFTVDFSSSTTTVCTITSVGALTFGSAGSCTINADQVGNSATNPAPQVQRTFTVNAIAPGAPTSPVATAGDKQASVAFTAPASNGGSTITGYTVTVNPPNVAPVNGASSPIVVTGLTNGQAYTFTVTANNVAGTGPASTVSNAITPKIAQTITFNNPGPQNFATPPTLTATSDSGLTPTFTSSTTGVCTITSGGTLTFVTAGSCTINADQDGDGTHLPAMQVSRSFAVNAQLSVSGTVAGMAGTATATLSGGGASCTLNPSGTGFMALSSAPAGRTLPHDGFAFLATGCSGSVTLTLVYPQALPAGVQFWKLGPATAGATASTWFAWSDATLSSDRKTVSYTVPDNGAGDSDSAVGTIRDPFAPTVAATPVAVPANSPWALALLVAMLAWVGATYRPRVQRR